MKQTSLEIFVILQVEMHVLVPITIIYILMFVTGVLGNAAVCFVIVHNKSMHTATNYYLFSLAISDLIILLLGKKKPYFLRQSVFVASILKWKGFFESGGPKEVLETCLKTGLQGYVTSSVKMAS